MVSRTIPEIFIIESLSLDDEEARLQEGELIAKMLLLSGKEKTKYYYIRTKLEFDEIVDLFDESNYRYLHLSCHANKKEMSFTFDTLAYDELGTTLGPCLENRKVFASACEMANRACAKALLKDTGCTSLIGPAKKINFDDSAAFWITFYHLMFKADDQAMRHDRLAHYTREISTLFGEAVNYFRRDPERLSGFRKIVI